MNLKSNAFKLGVLGILLCALVATISMAEPDAEKRSPTKWVPIYGLHIRGVKTFIETNSQRIATPENKEKFNTAEMLFSYDKLTKVGNGQNEYQVRGIVKSVMVDCKSGAMISLFDIYFKEASPDRNALPLGGFEYPKDQRAIARLGRNTPLYNALCPVYI